MQTKQEARPVLKIEVSKKDTMYEIASALLLLMLWVLSIYTAWHSAAAHTASPKPGAVLQFLILPLLGSLVFTALTLLNRYPHRFNYPVKLTAENALQQYSLATRLIRYLKFIVVLTFALFALSQLLAEQNRLHGLAIWLLPVFLLLIYVPLIRTIMKLFKAE